MPMIAFLTGLGWPEILLILALVLVLFGPKRLPEIAEAMGKSIRKFKSATSDATRDVKRELDDVNRELRDEKSAKNERSTEGTSAGDPATPAGNSVKKSANEPVEDSKEV